MQEWTQESLDEVLHGDQQPSLFITDARCSQPSHTTSRPSQLKPFDNDETTSRLSAHTLTSSLLHVSRPCTTSTDEPVHIRA
jgi:hypothetical protein